MSKCDFNKVALRLYWKHTSAWVFSCKFPAYIQNTFSQEHLWVAVSEMLNFIKFDKRVSFQKSFFQKIVLFKKFLLKIGFSSRKEFRNFVETRNYWLMKKEGHIIIWYSLKKVLWKICINHRKAPALVSLIKVQRRCFPVNLAIYLKKNSYFDEHLQMAASVGIWGSQIDTSAHW